MILINLLPHREARRAQRKRAFFIGLGGSFAGGLLIAALWYTTLQQVTAAQNERNAFLRAEIARLDAQIKDIAGLRAETAELEARGRVVQSLQERRAVSVHLLTALAEQTPAGLQLLSARQTGRVVVVSGLAVGSEQVAALMRDTTVASSPFERAELVEVRASPVANGAGRGADRRLLEFALRLNLRPELESAQAASTAAPQR